MPLAKTGKTRTVNHMTEKRYRAALRAMMIAFLGALGIMFLVWLAVFLFVAH